MNSIDEDAKMLGIDQQIWREFREMNKTEQLEFEEITGPVDDCEAKKRHLESIRNRWFGYYRKYKGDRTNIIDQYNKIALMRGNDR